MVRSPEASLEIGADASITLRTEEVPVPPALFRWTLEAEGAHSADRKFLVSAALNAETRLEPNPPRGRYQVEARWVLADTFGFFRWSPRRRWTGVLTVAGAATPGPPPPRPRMLSGTWRPRKTGRRAGDPFDVRRYADGDDLRRIHWPLFAHAGLLFVRTADPSPPPLGRWTVILDTEAPSETALDQRLGTLVRWLSGWDALGQPWTVVLPSRGLTLRAGQTWADELAALTPAPLPDRPEGTFGSGSILLTGPGSRGAVRWTGLFAGAGLEVRPVVVPEPTPEPAVRRPWWSRP